MSRFKRLTDAEARTLTRRELLDRIEAEQAYWFRKKTMTAGDDAAFREFTRIMHAYLSPAWIAEAIQDTIDYIEGRSPGSYWDTRPGEESPRLPPMDANQRAGLDYARRAFGIGGRQGEEN
ncbi:MAG: hypothetical protein ACRDPD_07020 [Streptosporangiaceae bacterium]